MIDVLRAKRLSLQLSEICSLHRDDSISAYAHRVTVIMLKEIANSFVGLGLLILKLSIEQVQMHCIS